MPTLSSQPRPSFCKHAKPLINETSFLSIQHPYKRLVRPFWEYINHVGALCSAVRTLLKRIAHPKKHRIYKSPPESELHKNSIRRNLRVKMFAAKLALLTICLEIKA